MENGCLISVGSKMRFIAGSQIYKGKTFFTGQVYEVSEICLHGKNRVPAFKFKGVKSDWVTEKYFELVG